MESEDHTRHNETEETEGSMTASYQEPKPSRAGTSESAVRSGEIVPDESPMEPGQAGEVEQARRHALTSFAMQGPVTDLVVADTLRRDENPVLVYLASLSEGSRRSMRGSLEIVAGFVSGGRATATELAWWNLRYQHTALIRSTLSGLYAPATANKMLSAVKGVLRQCFRLGYMSSDDYGRAADVPPVRGTRLSPGRSIDRGELFALFRHCAEDDKKLRGIRDAAILSLLYVCGMRRTELTELMVSDYDPDTLEVRVRGKGSKERMNYAEGGADRILNRWLELRGTENGPLILPVNKGGRIVYGEPMRDQSIYKIVKRRQREAGVKDLSPHDFRKTFIGDILDAIGDLSAAQQLAGHSDPRTTSRYDRRGERAKRKAASHLHVPYFEEGGRG